MHKTHPKFNNTTFQSKNGTYQVNNNGIKQCHRDSQSADDSKGSPTNQKSNQPNEGLPLVV